MRNKTLITYLLIIIPSFIVYCQENSLNFQNKEYVKINNEWNVLNASDMKHYKIEDNIVTIKFVQNTPEQNIQNYISQNNLTLLRKAITGWYDFRTSNVTDIFQKATQLIGTSPSIVDKLEIPTIGTYDMIPNDSLQASQWYLTTINAYDAWNIETGKPNVKVGILDSGAAWTHEDLGIGLDDYQNINLNSGEDSWLNQDDPSDGNGIDDDGNGFIDDWKGWNFAINSNNSTDAYSHGTYVSGIVGAKTNNNRGISGISGGWNGEGSKLLICSIGINAPVSSVFDDAILYAASMGVKVINISAGATPSAAIDDAITYVYNTYGVLIVGASGNGGTSTAVSYPASHPLVISVGATNRDDTRATFSHYGSNLFISAPGVNILSTNIGNVDNENLYSCNGCDSGTSFSAPMVTGTIALMYSVNPCLTPDQVKQILKSTAEKVGGYNYNWNSNNIGHSRELGYGRLNTFLAVQMARSMGYATSDLIIRDSAEDIGTEPNQISSYIWDSPDIWVRNQDDGLTFQQHQNPKYFSNGQQNYIYVRVTNKSCSVSSGEEHLKVYYALNKLWLKWPTSWNLISPFVQITIPPIQPGQEAIFSIPWTVPNPSSFPASPITFDGRNNFSLLARIESSYDPMTFLETGTVSGVTNNSKLRFSANVRNNNNIAWKNKVVIDVASRNNTVVTLKNLSTEIQNCYIKLVKENDETGKSIYEEAEVSVKLDETLFNAWERGGKLAQELNATIDEKKKIVKGNNVILDNISLNPNETGSFQLYFNFLTQEITDKNKYSYHVILKDSETDEIIGGESLTIKKEQREIFEADAGDTKEVDKNQPITISATQISEPAIYNWYDTDGNLISTGEDLTIATHVAAKYKLEVIAIADGFKDYSEVNVIIKPSILSSISPNPASNNVDISYKLNEVGSAYLMVLGAYQTTGTSNNYILDPNSSQTTINIADYQNGFYTIVLICNGQIVDAKTLYKE